MRPHGNARADPRRPRAWAICDKCGFLYNKFELQWQYEWQGARTQNTNRLTCDECLDDLQEQNRVIVLPADPQPVSNPRPENYNYADNQIATIGINFGTINQAAGLQAAFDSNTNKPFFMSAVSYKSIAGLSNTIGKNWTGLNPNTPLIGPMAVRIVVNAPNDAKLAAAGAVAWAFQGSNVPAGFITLTSGVTAGTIGEIIDVTFTATTGYLFHQFVLTGDGTSSVSVAQLQIYRAA
jgi:hypothetical protein